jgi:hypothetical protein
MAPPAFRPTLATCSPCHGFPCPRAPPACAPLSLSWTVVEGKLPFASSRSCFARPPASVLPIEVATATTPSSHRFFLPHALSSPSSCASSSSCCALKKCPEASSSPSSLSVGANPASAHTPATSLNHRPTTNDNRSTPPHYWQSLSKTE